MSKTQTDWDVIVVGQGLAGTTLAWCLADAGQRVLVLDKGEPVTSSKVAAGLLTPITGWRMALGWHYDDFLAAARGFYAAVERRTGAALLHERAGLRLFATDRERDNWLKRSGQAPYHTYLLRPQPVPLLDPEIGDASLGGFAMRSAQLDVPAYLQASRDHLTWEATDLDWARDVTIGTDLVEVKGHRTRRLISCEGFAASRNPYFSAVPFAAAKGEILTVRFAEVLPPDTLHRGIWVAPTAEPDVFKVGATYDTGTLDQTPSSEARDKLEDKLKEFLHVPYEVLDHRAAVRPIITQSRAYIGMHPEHDRIGFLNGLGSKGSLHAPWYAQRFTGFLVDGTPIPEVSDVRKFF